MAGPHDSAAEYFIFSFPLAAGSWDRYGVDELVAGAAPAADRAYEIRRLADRVDRDRRPGEGPPPPAETLLALRTLNQALRHVGTRYFRQDNPGSLERGRQWNRRRLGNEDTQRLFGAFLELYPPLSVRRDGVAPDQFLSDVAGPVTGRDATTLEMLLLHLNVGNPAAGAALPLFDDEPLRRRAPFLPFVSGFEQYLGEFEAPGGEGMPILQLLRAPMLAAPESLSGQIAYVRDHWAHLLPDDLRQRLVFALDVLREADVARGGEPGPPPVLEFGPGRAGWRDDRPEPEAFSVDADWMANVVLMAKSVYVWLDQLSRRHGRTIDRLDLIPDEELDRLAAWGVNGLWLIGLWQRSEASRLIKQWMGNPDAAASAYALDDYRIADDLGGEEAWRDLSERAGRRGIRLASDMVPNHMGIDSRWVRENPDYFLQSEHSPYPGYRFTGGDLCTQPGTAVRIEDGYWDHSDAAVVFQRVDEHTGRVRHIYHGNDGTSMPWNDTAQLNFLLPEVREAVIRVILDVARRFPIIRFDAAMTLAKKHFQRLWFPAPGDAGAIPSRAEHGLTRDEFDRIMPVEFWREVVDRVAAEAPGTLLLAEAFWLMEGYFVRTLGMHRVYNSAFMNMLKMEDNAKYRQTIKNVLEFSPPVLQRFVNFMNNPDERTAVEQFGRGDKYFGCMLLLVTMPGLPMIGHGQIEGFTEKYGMEYRRAYWDESVDEDMVRRHEREIFPLMRRRHLFSGSEHFALFDLAVDGGWVDENVFAYTNRCGDERALILYNNAYESTRGRLHHSSAVNTASADAPHLERRTLGQALGLPAEDGAWCAFRDHMTGLEYLRAARELHEVGVQIDLGGYQSRVLIDWRVMTDGDGTWARLADALQGGGTPDLALARRRLLASAPLAAVREWMASSNLGALESAPADEESPARRPAVLAAAADRITAWHASAAPAGLGPRTTGDLEALREALPGSGIPQALYTATVLGLTADEEPELQGLTADDGDLVAAVCEEELERWCGHHFAARQTTLLARLLHAFPGVPEDLAAGRTGRLAELLASPEAAEFTGRNEHAGRSWLVRERLEALLDGLATAALLQAPEAVVAVLDARDLVSGRAEAAGYDAEVLIAGLAGGRDRPPLR